MRAMLLNLQNGMRIQDSLEVSKSVVKNYVMLSIFWIAGIATNVPTKSITNNNAN